MGIVGLGQIGMSLARMAKGLGMESGTTETYHPDIGNGIAAHDFGGRIGLLSFPS